MTDEDSRWLFVALMWVNLTVCVAAIRSRSRWLLIAAGIAPLLLVTVFS